MNFVGNVNTILKFKYLILSADFDANASSSYFYFHFPEMPYISLNLEYFDIFHAQ